MDLMHVTSHAGVGGITNANVYYYHASSPMLGCQNGSPEYSKNLKTFKSKRKLPFSENFESASDADPDSCDSFESKSKITNNSKSLTPRRTTPLSERQQIALLCKLSACDQSLTENSPGPNEENFEISQKRNERGETPLHVATIKGDLSKVRQLLKQGVCVNATDFAGWTPLHEACNHGWYEIAKLLIQFGANVNAPGLEKDTPLHDAAVNKHEKIVRLLIKYGADPLQKNANKRTPFDVARSSEVSEILKSSIQLKQEQHLKEEATPYQDHLRTPEAVGNRQSENSPCHPISAACEPTMRKNSPQNQTHKGAEKPTSPRLTLRFQSIRTRDDKSTSSAKVSDISTSQPKYQSYCVTMEAKGDVYDFRKDDAIVSSTQNLSSIDGNDESGVKCDAVSSTSSKEAEECGKENSEEPEGSDKPTSIDKMDASESILKANGGRVIGESNIKDKECSSDIEKEENRRKRRKSNDSVQSRHSTTRGHKSPSNKSQPDSHNDQRSPKARKRGSLSSSDTESNPSDAEAMSTDANAESGNFNGSSSTVNPHSPKVPPLKIVIPSGTGSLELETRERNKVSSSKQALPYVVNTTTSDTIDTDSVSGTFSGDGIREPSKPESSLKSKDENHPPEERFQRVTRSSQRMQQAMSGTAPNQCHNSESTHSNVVSSSSQKGDASGESSNDEQMQIQVDVHPRKRKLRTKENVNENGSQNPSCASSSSEDSQQQHQSLNCYQMYLNIRKQVDKRRRSMFIVQPKAPSGYEHYLLNRCSYVLEGNPSSRLSVPMISPPQSLEGSIKELFIHQEKERYQLRLQHLIEREKLVLSVEQEILRVHGRAARAMSNQTVPLSVCSILKDEEIYNVLEDDKDKNVRSRYNGRLFLSWLQDVDDKWEKIKGAMLLRHHNEAESLHAVQKLDWEWKMKELAMCDMKSSPIIDDIFVPMVHVSDDFDLLPA